MEFTLQLEVMRKTLIEVKKLKFDDFPLKKKKDQDLSFPELSFPGLGFQGLRS